MLARDVILPAAVMAVVVLLLAAGVATAITAADDGDVAAASVAPLNAWRVSNPVACAGVLSTPTDVAKGAAWRSSRAAIRAGVLVLPAETGLGTLLKGFDATAVPLSLDWVIPSPSLLELCRSSALAAAVPAAILEASVDTLDHKIAK